MLSKRGAPKCSRQASLAETSQLPSLLLSVISGIIATTLAELLKLSRCGPSLFLDERPPARSGVDGCLVGGTLFSCPSYCPSVVAVICCRRGRPSNETEVLAHCVSQDPMAAVATVKGFPGVLAELPTWLIQYGPQIDPPL